MLIIDIFGLNVYSVTGGISILLPNAICWLNNFLQKVHHGLHSVIFSVHLFKALLNSNQP